MRESISITTIFQIFILFVLLFTAIMCLTINNSNAFGVKDSIINAIESLDGNYLDGSDLNEEIVQVIQETSYRTSGTCPDGYSGFDRAGNSVGSNSSDAAVCIRAVHTTEDLDTYLEKKLGAGNIATTDFVEGIYYQVVLFFQLDIPVFKQVFNFQTKGETRTIYNTTETALESSSVNFESYTNTGNMAKNEPTQGTANNVNPVGYPGVSSGGGTTTQPPEEEEETPIVSTTCDTTGLNLDTSLGNGSAVVFGEDNQTYRIQNGTNAIYGAIYSEPELKTEVARMTPGTVFQIVGTLAGNDTIWYVQNGDTCGWAEGSYLGIDFGFYAQSIGATVKMQITNQSSSQFRVNGQAIQNVTGRALYSGMTINPLQYNFAKIVGQAALNANAGGDTLVIYETYRPQDVTNKVAGYYRDTVNASSELRNYLSGYNLSAFLADNSSQHNRGCAVDVSLAGKEDMMPSDMHELGPLASGSNSYSSTLASYFTRARAKTIGSEWWHFDYGKGASSVCINIYSDFWSGM